MHKSAAPEGNEAKRMRIIPAIKDKRVGNS